MMEHDLRERWRLRMSRAAVLLVPVLIAGLAYLLTQQAVRADLLEAEEHQSQERRALILSVLSAHQDLETGQRGFLITGSEEFLAPYSHAMRRLQDVFSELRDGYSEDPGQLRRIAVLEALSQQKAAFAATALAMYRAGEARAANAMVVNGRGKSLMDEIRRHLAGLLSAETERLKIISEESHRAIEGFRHLTYGLLATLMAVLGAAALAISRTLKRRNEALVALEDVSSRRKAILDAAMDAIITLNPSGTIEGVNAAALRMFGYSEDELLRRDIGVLSARPSHAGLFAAEMREMNLVEGESGALKQVIGLRKDGSTFPADAAITLNQLSEGTRYVAVVRDSTERHRVERMKSEFVSTVSHELRTPLSSISGSLGLLAGGAAGPLEGKAARLVEIARNNADRLVRLINDILDIEKLEFGSMRFINEPLDLNSVAADALDANSGYAASYGVGLELSRTHEPAMVFADRDRLTQVLTNLLSNAIKFSPQDGTVTLTVTAGDGACSVSVRDRGPGIPAEFRKRIFGKFAQADSSDSRQKGGTGLGLSIAREIVTQLGGTIGFDSEEGQGTCFHVTLPAHNAPATTSCVLICGTPGAAIRDELASTQLSLVFEESTEAAVERLAQEPFAAIVVDMDLPDGGGLAISHAARASTTNASTPVLAIGASSLTHASWEGAAALIAEWLHSPDKTEMDQPSSRRSVAGQCRPPRVLHVDDDPDVLRIVSEALEGHAQVVSASTLASARNCLAREHFDLAVLDLTLSDGSGTELLPDLLDADEEPIPVLIFSAEDAGSTTVGQVEAFLTKARTPMSELVDAIERLANSERIRESSR